MKTFGTLEARRPKGLSQRDLASKVKKEDGQAISAQYLNDMTSNMTAAIQHRRGLRRQCFDCCDGLH